MSFRCPHCQDRLYLLEPQGELMRARACPCSRSCIACGGEGRVFTKGPEGYTFAALCPCRTLEARLARFNRARLPARSGLSFDTYLPGNEEQAKARDVARTTAMLYRRQSPTRGFLLSGPVGSGKTHLISAALSHLTLEVGASARYVEISFLFAEIRHGFNQGRSGLEAIQPLIDVDVLAIDELGKGRGSAFELDTLDELIARRYNANRTTLVATNFALADRVTKSASHFDPSSDRVSDRMGDREAGTLKDRVGERIWSRLNEMCHFIQFPPQTRDFRRRTA